MTAGSERMILALPQQFILQEISVERMKRKDVAMTYALIMRDQRDEVDWAVINSAIVARWSPSALEFIKDQAWSGECWRHHDRRR